MNLRMISVMKRMGIQYNVEKKNYVSRLTLEEEMILRRTLDFGALKKTHNTCVGGRADEEKYCEVSERCLEKRVDCRAQNCLV